MLKKVVVFCIFVFNVFVSNSIQDNNLKSSDESVIEIGAYNIRKNNNDNYLIDIYASNSQSIAGLQFELLGQDFQILDASGGRAALSGFSFYNGKGGVILAFSLQGKAVLPVEEVYKKVNPLLTITAKKINDKASEFNLKTLISSQKGIKINSKFIPAVIK